MANLPNHSQKNNPQQVHNLFPGGNSEVETFDKMKLQVISNRVLLYELKSDTTSLLRKKAIVDALRFAKQLTEKTRKSHTYYFAENRGTGLIHVISEIVDLSYHPCYLFEKLSA